MTGSPLLAVALGFAVLLGVSAWGKLRDLRSFQAVAADYRLLPTPLLPAVRALPVAEAMLAAAWLAAPWQVDVAFWAGFGTAALMLGYAAAMAANLLRGRAWIDCGCGGGEQVSWPLVGRNLVLAAVALAPIVIADPAPPGWSDLAVSAPLLAVATLLYLAGGALLRNADAMRGIERSAP